MNNIIVQTALLCEARPLIDHYRLKKDFAFTKFDVFRNNGITLIVSGIGRLKATMAATHILDQSSDKQHLIILNLGIAGSTTHDYGIGNVFLINKIIDTNSRRNYYPDLLFRHDLPEQQVATFDQVVTAAETVGDFSGLVDMESSGFAAAALTFMAPHQVVLLKIVSDHLEVDHLTAHSVSEIIAGEISQIEKLIEILREMKLMPASTIPVPEQSIIDQITSALRLTAAQQRILRNDLFRCQLLFGEIPTGWEEYTAQPTQTKTERNQRFSKLREFLNGK